MQGERAAVRFTRAPPPQTALISRTLRKNQSQDRFPFLPLSAQTLLNYYSLISTILANHTKAWASSVPASHSNCSQFCVAFRQASSCLLDFVCGDFAEKRLPFFSEVYRSSHTDFTVFLILLSLFCRDIPCSCCIIKCVLLETIKVCFYSHGALRSDE